MRPSPKRNNANPALTIPDSRRRANHEGSVRKRGSTWQARIQLEGTRYVVSGATRAEAVRQLNRLIAQWEAGTLHPAGPSVGDWLCRWLENGERRWKVTTLERYADIARLHLCPAFGTLPLASLTPDLISDFLARPSRLTEQSKLKVFRTLHAALNVAVQEGQIDRNPCVRATRPRNVQRQPSLWDRDQIRQFVSQIPLTPNGALWAILLGSGCRLGEALALRWQDYDCESGTISVAGTLSETRQHGHSRTAPKTRAGFRALVLPTFARTILSEWAGQAQLTPSEPIVLNPFGNSPTRRGVEKAFATACNRAGVPAMRVHDLRHLHASLLLGEGVPIPLVSSRLGHASTAVTTAIYAHALKGEDALAPTAIDRVIG